MEDLSLPQKKIQLHNNGSLLRLNGVQTNQEGRYTCLSRNKVGHAEADTFLDVIAPPQIAPGPPELKVIEGQGQTIHCEAIGSPTPTVTWLKNGRPFDSALVHSSTAGHYIHVVEALREDGARYTCIAKNDAGEVRRTTTLTVLVPPTIDAGERVLNVIENRSLQVEAFADGFPEPSLTWFVNGEKVDGSERFSVDNAVLTIVRAERKDRGRYSVEAKNEAGSASVDFAVEVLQKPKFNDHNPDINVIEGNRATLECQVEAKPKAEIRWLKAGRPLDTRGSSNIILSPRGEKLMILDAERNDAGSYSCVAKNSAGESDASFTVTVYVAPYLEGQVNQNPKVVLGGEVTIPCPVQGIPKPEIEWKKDGEKLEEVTLGSNGKDLLIQEATAEDDGRYTCHAENEAGFLDTDYALKVIAPPKFGGGIREYKVIIEDSITMDCAVEAEPKPEITWYKGEEPLYIDQLNMWFSGDKQQLTITQARLEDGGGYTCEATNVAGKNKVEMVLKVLVPPRIDKSNIIGNPLAIVNKSIVLECPATGIPSPNVKWEKDGQPLLKSDTRISYSENNQTIKLDNVAPTDEGRFVCIAENEAGAAEQEFNLEVLKPPRMEKAGREKIVVTEGEQVIMTCPIVIGVQEPVPDISWTKDGRPLDPLSLPNMRLQSEGRRLHITSATLSDEGIFTCVGSNRAGESQMEYEVEVLSPPLIDGSRNEPQPRVIINRDLTLWCMVSGHPFPTVAWYKDGESLTPTELASEYQLLEENQGLRVKEAQLKHSGRYTCKASNTAGTKELDLALDVWVPPTVSISGENFVAPLQASIMIKCQAAGNPPPTLTWSKDSQTLLTSPTGARISGDGVRVDIPRLTRSDVGRYTCIATNPAGVAEASVDIDVLVPPVINRDNIDMNPRLPAGQTLTLACEATGKPMPDLNWFYNDEKITGNTDNWEIADSGRYLQINNIGLADKGVYKCVASNSAGTDEILYNVEIVEKPMIRGGRTIQVIEGETAVITCEASGTPPPEIWWQRNGQRIETRDRYVVGDNTLQVTQSRSQDAGIYVCIATNNVGSAQQAYTLEVLVPPKIVDISPPDNNLPIGSPLTLLCGARGYPEPTIEWFRNGVSLSPQPEKYRVSDEGTLTVAAITNDDRGVFKCVATNPAGSDSKDYEVTLIRPPTISSDGIIIINVTQGDPTSMKCDVQEPIPEIVWYKGSNLVDMYANPSMELTNRDRELKIRDTRLTDAGDYRCVAKNPAGNATQRFRLHVGVPPRITEEPRRIIAKNGTMAVLPCEALGVPEPVISWSHDEEPVPETYRQGDSVRFPSATPDQAGIYTCQAKNWAGTGYKDIELIVQVPPKIIPERMNVTVKENQTVTLECNATGNPEPTIEWYMEPNIKLIGGEKYEMVGNNVVIRNVKAGDDSFYRCLARNDAGVAVGYRRLNVELPKKDWKVIWVQCDEQGRPVRTLFKPARGDVPEDDGGLLPYGTELLDLPANGTQGTLIRCLPNRNDTANKPLELSKQPVLVELPKNQVQTPGSAMSMTCAAIGRPEPEILWSHNGTLLPDNPITAKGKSTLRVEDIGYPQAGTYGCLARNTHGSATAVATLRVEKEKVAVADRLESAYPIRRRRFVAMLDCDRPHVEEYVFWTKGGRIVTTSAEAKVLSNGSLVVFDANNEFDLGRYKCVVNKAPGHVTIKKSFIDEKAPKVLVSPKRQEAEVGDTAFIHCKVDGDEVTSHISWFHNNNPMVIGPKTSIHTNNTLELIDVDTIDRGVYKCVAVNTIGQSQDEASIILKDTPNLVHGYIQGSLNDVRFDGQQFNGDVTPFTDNNQISIKVDNLPLEFSSAARTTLGYITSPCWMMAYPEEGSMNGYKITNGHANTKSEYKFQTGQKLNVEHNAMGLDSKGYLVLDVLVDGEMPDFPEQQVVTLDPITENYVQTHPGQIQGYGSGTLNIGTEQKVPFSYYHNITYENSKKMPTPSANVHVEAIDLVTSGSLRNRLSYEFKTNAKISPNQECPAGFQKDNDLSQCYDINECETKGKSCSHGCMNIPGSFYCTCPIGFTLKDPKSYICLDIDECTTGKHRCKGDQECRNILGSYECVGHCDPGYSLNNNGSCVDLNECVLGLSNCAADEECVNTIGSFECAAKCKLGYRRNIKGHCKDIDECRESIPCHPDRLCVNTEGSYQCDCKPGFTGQPLNGPCTDINECTQLPHVCEYGCANLLGSFHCFCPPGSFLLSDGKACSSVQMPKAVSSLRNAEKISNSEEDFPDLSDPFLIPLGGVDEFQSSSLRHTEFSSGCPPGQRRINGRCQTMTACERYQPCEYKCQNTFDSYNCTCPSGYVLAADRHSCEDIDECQDGLDNCMSDSLCFNQRGGFRCLDFPCPSMYTLNSFTRECRLTCKEEGPHCPPNLKRLPDIINIQLLALPNRIRAKMDLIRLTAYDSGGQILRRTRFSVRKRHHGLYLPFEVRTHHGIGTLYTTGALQPGNYNLGVRANSFGTYGHQIRYRKDFLIFISVSEHPF